MRVWRDVARGSVLPINTKAATVSALPQHIAGDLPANADPYFDLLSLSLTKTKMSESYSNQWLVIAKSNAVVRQTKPLHLTLCLNRRFVLAVECITCFNQAEEKWYHRHNFIN